MESVSLRYTEDIDVVFTKNNSPLSILERGQLIRMFCDSSNLDLQTKTRKTKTTCWKNGGREKNGTKKIEKLDFWLSIYYYTCMSNIWSHVKRVRQHSAESRGFSQGKLPGWWVRINIVKVHMKRKFIFDIFVNKGLKMRFLLLKLNIALFYNLKISVKHDVMRQIPRGRQYVHNSLWRKYLCKVPVVCCKKMAFNGICKGITSLLVPGPL